MSAVTIDYNNKTIATLEAGKTASLFCEGKVMADNLNITVPKDMGGLSINGIIEQYKVNAGATVSAGDFVEFVKSVEWGSGEFSSGSAGYTSACKLDDNRVLVVYQDGGNSSHGTAIVLSISGTTITTGTAKVFNSATTNNISAVALTDSKVLVAYRDDGNSYYGTAIVLSISGTTITAGTAKVFNSATTNASTEKISAVALTDSKVLVAYGDDGNSSYGTAIVLSISGTTITAGTAKVFNSATTNSTTNKISAVALTDSKVLVSYYAGTVDVSTRYHKAIVLSISGTTITAGTAITLSSRTNAHTNNISAVALTDSKVLVTYSNGGNSNYGTAIVLSISGTTITTGTAKVFNSATTNNISAVALTDSKVLVTYSNGGNSSHGTAIVLSISGTTITTGTAKVFNSATTSRSTFAFFSPTSVLVCYNSGIGCYKGFNIDGTTITEQDGIGGDTFVQPTSTRGGDVGVAKTAGAEGETVEVYCVGAEV